MVRRPFGGRRTLLEGLFVSHDKRCEAAIATTSLTTRTRRDIMLEIRSHSDLEGIDRLPKSFSAEVIELPSLSSYTNPRRLGLPDY